MTDIRAIAVVDPGIQWTELVHVPHARVLEGDPATSTVVLDSSERHQLGFWKATKGSFTTDHTGYIEYIRVLGGAGRLVSDNAEVTELKAGTTVLLPAGWKGRWEVDAELSKV